MVTPTASGISVARPRKNSSESTSRIGKAISSARPRSSPTVSPICRPATAPPPTVTPPAPAKVSSADCATASSSAPARSVAVTRPSPPARPPAVVDATPGDLRELALDRRDPPGRRIVDEQHDARVGVSARGGLDALHGDLGVGAGGDEPAGALERPRDRAADGAGEDHEEQDRDQGAARVGREA